MGYIESLRVFRSVVELKSFTQAAERHAMTRPTVSRIISELEERMGCRLLDRTTRQVSLAASARRFYDGCVSILDDLDAIEADVTNQVREPVGELRLLANTTITMHRLVPLIAGFKRAYPRITLEVALGERPVDLVVEGYDIGIVVPYMLVSESVVSQLLERIPFVLVATPEYLRNSPTLREPADIAQHLFVPLSPSLRRPYVGFQSGDGELNIPLSFNVSSNSATLNRELVLQDLGIGVAPVTLVEDELASGRLVALFRDHLLVEGWVESRLAYSNRKLLPAKVRAFVSFATEFFRNMPAPRA
ncbi:MAG TPA: LysR family transcriptional regulator [Granulicella sp.]